MKRLIVSLVALCVCAFVQSANADTTKVEIRAYSAPGGDVLLLPATTKTTSYKVVSESFVHGGDVLTVVDKKVTLPAEIAPGMLISPTGVILGTDAVLMDGGKVKIKTKEGKTIIKYDD